MGSRRGEKGHLIGLLAAWLTDDDDEPAHVNKLAASSHEETHRE